MSSADDRIENDEWPGGRSSQTFKYMVVEFNTGGANFIMGGQTASRKAAVVASSGEADSINTSESLKKASTAAMTSRSDKVAAATAMINDPGYPSDEVIARMASFLAPRI